MIWFYCSLSLDGFDFGWLVLDWFGFVLRGLLFGLMYWFRWLFDNAFCLVGFYVCVFV